MLFAVQIANNALFYHTHNIDGKTYAHAHPNCDGHSHKAADFVFYQQLQTILFEEIPKLLVEQFPIIVCDFDSEVCIAYDRSAIKTNAGRAPPVV